MANIIVYDKIVIENRNKRTDGNQINFRMDFHLKYSLGVEFVAD